MDGVMVKTPNEALLELLKYEELAKRICAVSATHGGQLCVIMRDFKMPYMKYTDGAPYVAVVDGLIFMKWVNGAWKAGVDSERPTGGGYEDMMRCLHAGSIRLGDDHQTLYETLCSLIDEMAKYRANMKETFKSVLNIGDDAAVEALLPAFPFSKGTTWFTILQGATMGAKLAADAASEASKVEVTDVRLDEEVACPPDAT